MLEVAGALRATEIVRHNHRTFVHDGKAVFETYETIEEVYARCLNAEFAKACANVKWSGDSLDRNFDGIQLSDYGFCSPRWGVRLESDAMVGFICGFDPLAQMEGIQAAVELAVEQDKPISAVLAHDICKVDALPAAREWLDEEDELLLQLERDEIAVLAFAHDLARRPHSMARIENGRLTGILLGLEDEPDGDDAMVALRDAEWLCWDEWEPEFLDEVEPLLIWLALSDILPKEA